MYNKMRMNMYMSYMCILKAMSLVRRVVVVVGNGFCLKFRERERETYFWFEAAQEIDQPPITAAAASVFCVVISYIYFLLHKNSILTIWRVA